MLKAAAFAVIVSTFAIAHVATHPVKAADKTLRRQRCPSPLIIASGFISQAAST
jgi:hypothetical protein